MRIHRAGLMFAALALISLTIPGDIDAARDHSYYSKKKKSSTKSSKSSSKSKLKSFDSMIKDKVVIEGLFTFYHDTTDNSMLMAVKPEQMNQVYLCGMSMSRGDGAFVEGQRMYGEFPWYFKQVGTKLMFMEKNVRIRADEGSPAARAIEKGVSDGLFASTKVLSKPQDSTDAILINPSDFFVKDATNLGYFVGQRAKTGLGFDSKNSYFGKIKSFPQNSEIDVVLHYKSKKPLSGTALQNSYSFFHTFHFSLSTLPESDYKPRLADDRIGHFLSMYQDYNELDTETPYVRNINRWHMKKKNPGARISEPIEPIVYWVENTVPEKYRDAIAEGIEFWNPAFEKIGFRNAVVAKQMPDTADWDPADVRYSTVRWLIAKNYPYAAIGPSRANPFTGQIYDADVGFVADAVRSLYSRYEYQVSPHYSSETKLDEWQINDETEETTHRHPTLGGGFCEVSQGAYDAALGMTYLTSIGDAGDQEAMQEEYVHSFIVFVIAHEIGHTLGFRHNFISSYIYDMTEINDPEFTKKYGALGTVMDYPSPNVAGPGKEQGEFYASTPGPYDNWIVEYSYSDLGDATDEEESEFIATLLERAPERGLLYATDEDAFGSSPKSVDPRTNIWDSGDDPIAFSEHLMGLSQSIWHNSISKFEEPGARYQMVRNAFNSGWVAYYRAASIVPKFIGGLYHSRLHVGNADGELPYEVVPAAEQRRAIKFLSDNLFAADAFDLPVDLVNKLQEENLPDFAWTHYSRPTVDYPLHANALRYQNMALGRLYSSYVLGRLLNNLSRVPAGDDRYTMYDMFTDLRRAIWGEISGPSNVNSFRRQLQIAHLSRIVYIYLSGTAIFPTDARTLAANDLNVLEAAAKKAVNSTAINGMTKAHFSEVLRQIEAAKNARRDYSKF